MPKPDSSPFALLYAELGLGVPPVLLTASLGRTVRIASFHTGAVLVTEAGEVDDELWLIRRGRARLERQVDGQTQTVADFGPGDLVGEVDLLLGDAGTDRVVAATPVTAWRLSRAALAAAAAGPGARPLLEALHLRRRCTRLKAATPLAALAGPALTELAAQVEEEQVASGTVLLAAGEVPRRLSVLRAGRARVLAGTGARRRVVAELMPGDTYGEAALLADQPPPAELTVEAATELEIYHISPAALNQALALHPEAGAAVEQQVAGLNLVAFLRRARPFAGLDSPTLHRLAAAMQVQTVPAGTTFFREGEPGEAYYLVSRGRVVLDADESEAVKVLDEAGPGEGFGEGALVSGRPHDHTAEAAVDSEVLVLPRAVFLQVLRSRQQAIGTVARTLFERQLPRRIARWSALRQETTGGEVLYILKDEERGQYFKLSDRGYYLWEQMDGNTSIRDLVMAYFVKYHSLAMEQVVGVVESLRAAGFVHSQGPGEELLVGVRLPWHLRLAMGARRLLEWKLPIQGFDPMLTALYRGGGWILYTRPVQLMLAALAVSGLGAFAWLLAGGSLPPFQVTPGWGWLGLYGFFLAHALVHELAHALTVKAWGREVRQAGVGFYWGSPILYVNTSDIWMASRRARVMVSWAGPYLHLCLGSLLAWLLLLFPDLRQSTLLAQTLFLNYMFFIFNLFPLLEFDGYYMLMDYLEIPRLRSKALAFVRQQWRQPQSPRQWGRAERIYAVFGVLSGTYSLFAIGQILWMARSYVGGWVGTWAGTVTGTVAGWGAGALLALLLLWPALRELRGKGAAGA